MIEFDEEKCDNDQDVKDFFLNLDKGTIENAEEFKGVFRNIWTSGSYSFIKLKEKGKNITI